MGNSLAIIEVVGMPSAIQAGDIAVKAANVELLGYELTKGSGFIAVKLKGDVGSIKAAAEAIVIAMDSSKIVGHIVIPRPSEAVEQMIRIDNMDLKAYENKQKADNEKIKVKKELTLSTEVISKDVKKDEKTVDKKIPKKTGN